MAKGKCPFTGETPKIEVSADGHAIVVSSHGWKSKVFDSEAVAEAWLKSTDLMAVKPSIDKVSFGRFIVRSAAGWYTRLMNSEKEAEEWLAESPAKKRGRKPKAKPDVEVLEDQMPDIIQYEED